MLNGIVIGLRYTSPMPEDAPMISTTFPATFSLDMVFLIQLSNLKTRYGSKHRSAMIVIIRGRAIFMNL